MILLGKDVARKGGVFFFPGIKKGGDDMPELKNKKHERFCIEYIVDLNASQAAIRTGYAPKNANNIGSRLLANADIRARVDELLAEMQNSRIADATEVLEYLTAVIRGEKQEEVLVTDPMGQTEIKLKAIGGREQVKAAELLAKRYSLLTDNVKMNGAAPVQIVDDLGAGDGGD